MCGNDDRCYDYPKIVTPLTNTICQLQYDGNDVPTLAHDNFIILS